MFGLFKQKKSRKPARPSREDLLKQARSNASAAREEIGEETLDKIRAHIAKKENNTFEQAKAKVEALDKERLADNIRAEMRDKD